MKQTTSKAMQINDTVRELIMSGRTEDAIRYSAEELALADGRFRNVCKSSRESERVQALSELLDIGVIHADCLFRGHYYNDVVSLSLSLLLMASVERPLTDESLGVAPLALCFLALVGLEAMSYRLSEIVSDVPDGDEHVRISISVLASILYRLYSGLSKVESPWVGRVYELLRPMLGAGIIQSPAIVMFGQDVDPASPSHALGDIIGRLRALGFNFGI